VAVLDGMVVLGLVVFDEARLVVADLLDHGFQLAQEGFDRLHPLEHPEAEASDSPAQTTSHEVRDRDKRIMRIPFPKLRRAIARPASPGNIPLSGG
jgi:hypothetical protein